MCTNDKCLHCKSFCRRTDCGICLEKLGENLTELWKCDTCAKRIHATCYRRAVAAQARCGRADAPSKMTLFHCPFCRTASTPLTAARASRAASSGIQRELDDFSEDEDPADAVAILDPAEAAAFLATAVATRPPPPLTAVRAHADSHGADSDSADSRSVDSRSADSELSSSELSSSTAGDDGEGSSHSSEEDDENEAAAEAEALQRLAAGGWWWAASRR